MDERHGHKKLCKKPHTKLPRLVALKPAMLCRHLSSSAPCKISHAKARPREGPAIAFEAHDAMNSCMHAAEHNAPSLPVHPRGDAPALAANCAHQDALSRGGPAPASEAHEALHSSLHAAEPRTTSMPPGHFTQLICFCAAAACLYGLDAKRPMLLSGCNTIASSFSEALSPIGDSWMQTARFRPASCHRLTRY